MRNKKNLEPRFIEAYNSYKERAEKQKALYQNPVRNKTFCFTAIWSRHLSALGVFEYLLNDNVDLFKQYLKESTLVEQELFENFEKGEPVHSSYVSLTTFWRMFFALATGDIELAKNFARYNGGRFEIEQGRDHPFAINFGYTLKYFIEEADEKTKQMCLKKLANDCITKAHFAFRGYITVFEAILEKNSEKANQGFKEIVIGHLEECKGKGDRYFKGTKEEYICIWGIGMANLAIYSGLNIKIDHPLIPTELLITNQRPSNDV